MLPIESIEFLKDFPPFKAGEKFEFKPGLNILCGDQGCGKSSLIYLLMESAKYKAKQTTKAKDMSMPLSVSQGIGHYKQEYEYEDRNEFTDVIKVVRNPFPGSYVYFSSEEHNPRIMAQTGGRVGMIAVRNFIEFIMDHTDNQVDLHNTLKILTGQYIKENKLDDIDAAITGKMRSHGETLLPMLQSIKDIEPGGLVYLDEPETALSLVSQNKIRQTLHDSVAAGCQLIVATHSRVLIESVPLVLSLQHRQWMSRKDFIESQIIDAVTV